MINSKMIFRILGFLLLIETAMLLCCGAVSLFYKENDLQSFLISSAVTACIGFLLLAIGKDAVKSLNRRDGYVIVSAAWVTFSLFGMLPYYIGGYIPNVADAFFETMSGFSSTGATIHDSRKFSAKIRKESIFDLLFGEKLILFPTV
jgi:trk system potassium uptake protein